MFKKPQRPIKNESKTLRTIWTKLPFQVSQRNIIRSFVLNLLIKILIFILFFYASWWTPDGCYWLRDHLNSTSSRNDSPKSHLNSLIFTLRLVSILHCFFQLIFRLILIYFRIRCMSTTLDSVNYGGTANGYPQFVDNSRGLAVTRKDAYFENIVSFWNIFDVNPSKPEKKVAARLHSWHLRTEKREIDQRYRSATEIEFRRRIDIL